MFKLLNKALRGFGYLVGMVFFFPQRLRKNVSFQKGARVFGIALVDIHPDASVEIGECADLNSMSRGYHLGMYGRVKIMADLPGATIRIGARTRFHGSCIHAQERITIGENCLIAAQCQIIDGHGHSLNPDNPADRINTTGETAPICIEDNVWLGTGVIVMPGVTIGQGSVVGAASVVTKDIPPGVLAAGVPAKVVRKL